MAQVQIVNRPSRWDEPFGYKRLPAEAIADILSGPVFEGVDRCDFPDDLQPDQIIANDARIVSHTSGDVIYKAGSYHTTLYVVLSGGVRLRAEPQLNKAADHRINSSRNSWIRASLRKARQLTKRGQGPSANRQAPRPQADIVLGRNEIFGESEALERTARTTTAVAETDNTLLLEIRWSGARELLHWSDAFRRKIEGLYRERSIKSGLRQCSLFADIDDHTLSDIADRCSFETFGGFDWTHAYQRERTITTSSDRGAANEPVILEQGQYLEDLFLFHSGFARVIKRTDQVDTTVGPLKRGEIVGMREIVESLRENGTPRAQYGLQAVGYANVIRIPVHAIEDSVLLSFIDKKMEDAFAGKRNSLRGQQLIDFVVDNRFVNGTKAMAIDTTRCVNCDDCVRACAATHNDVARFDRTGAAHGKFMIANACMHCADPVCLIDCPTDAIQRDVWSGNVIIDEKTCIGCGTCSSACPYNNIRMIDSRNSAGQLLVDKDGAHVRTASKCDLCAGRSSGPACLQACPHNAIERVDLRDPQTLSDWL